MGNDKWTSEIQWQHCANKTQDEDKQNKVNTTQQRKQKKVSKMDPTKTPGVNSCGREW